jgi:Fur family ferric uptake transcriptional regulator
MAARTIHKQEKEQFTKLFKQDRIDRFEDRLAVLDVFLRTEHHVTVEELTDLVQRAGITLSTDFVLQTIELMCHYGFAQRNQFDNGQFRYEHRHLGQHHDHMICTKCKAIIEFEEPAVEQLQLQIAARQGFHLLQHKMELYGICRQCLDRRDVSMPLDMARSGERLFISGFSGGAKSKLRLLTMGLRVGDAVEVITNAQHGQLVIAVDYKRLVLGQGLARKIQVSVQAPCKGDEKNKPSADSLNYLDRE